MKKRSVKIRGHLTSITMEEPFWDALKSIAKKRKISINALIAEIDAARADANLSSAIRIYILREVQAGG
jgi:predicted DNA-binding ribbon-helix-helix protein